MLRSTLFNSCFNKSVIVFLNKMSFSDLNKVSTVPLVVILGSTGTGKTKLSLELAQKFNGEIISADSMQVYKGLDIITAKATPEERTLAPHHLLDVVDPLKAFTVVDFRNAALKIIDDLFSKSKLPIVVGGTNYYIESLLWKVLVDDPGSKPGDKPLEDCDPVPKKPRIEEEVLSNEELYKKLQELDPEMAKKLHPNNRRKILRSLEVMKQRGKKHSEILKEQRNMDGGSSLGGPLRYPNSIILWLQCEQETLDKRLDSRVDKMIEQGLVQELRDFHTKYNQQRIQDDLPPDYTKGIFQSIGFKEFHNYLILDPSKLGTEDGKKLLEQGISDLKMVTRRYARKQIKWVSNRFLGRPDRQAPPVYSLDTTNVQNWDEKVKNPAFEIIESYLNDSKCSQEPLPLKSRDKILTPLADDEDFYCETCKRIFIGKLQWNAHRKSNKHKRVVEKLKKLEKIEKTQKDESVSQS